MSLALFAGQMTLAPTATAAVLPSGNYILSSLAIFIQRFDVSGAGGTGTQFQLQSSGASAITFFELDYNLAGLSGAGTIFINQLYTTTWDNLVLPRSVLVNMVTSSFGGVLIRAVISLNLYGIPVN